MNLEYLLALHRMSGIGIRKLNNYLNEIEEPNLLDANEILRELTKSADKIIWEGVEKDLAWANQENCYIVPRWSQNYPTLLKEIPDPPPVIFVRGDRERLLLPQIAIVGSRNPSPLGIETAANFAGHFSAAGITVTSGLALGIDTSGHKAAVSEKGGTIAVLGNSLETVYPASNQKLSQLIVQNGALVSEFPIGTPAIPSNFPRRNRIISGLSLGTLVVEAALKSGSLITTRFALEQGREVFAIPGSIHSPLAKGCHALIRQGAKLVETAEDVLEELKPLLHLSKSEMGKKRRSLGEPDLDNRNLEKLNLGNRSLNKRSPDKTNKANKANLDKPSDKPNSKNLSKAQRRILDKLGFEVTPIDVLVQRCELTTAEVSIILLELELENRVASVPGGYLRLG